MRPGPVKKGHKPSGVAGAAFSPSCTGAGSAPEIQPQRRPVQAGDGRNQHHCQQNQYRQSANADRFVLAIQRPQRRGHQHAPDHQRRQRPDRQRPGQHRDRKRPRQPARRLRRGRPQLHPGPHRQPQPGRRHQQQLPVVWRPHRRAGQPHQRHRPLRLHHRRAVKRRPQRPRFGLRRLRQHGQRPLCLGQRRLQQHGQWQ